MRRRFVAKVCRSGMEALADAKDGSSYLIPGFGIVGIPENSLRALHEKSIKNLVLYTNSVGLDNYGHGPMITSGHVARVFVSFLGFGHIVEKMFLKGEFEVNPIPQGSLVEKMRCNAGGLAGFYTRTSAGTLLEEGKFPVKFRPDLTPEKFCKKKEVMEFGGYSHVLEEAIIADYSLIKAQVGDKYGNLRFRKTSRNFNPDIAGSGRVTVAEVEHLVDRLDADQVHLSGMFVDRVYQGEWYGKKIERLQIRETEDDVMSSGGPDQVIGKRLAKEYTDGMYVNLGVGLPGESPKYIPEGVNVMFQVENGIVGGGGNPSMNTLDHDLINAGKMAIAAVTSHSYMGSSIAFGIMRGHHLHMTVLGGMQVSENGDLSNYYIPGKMYRGVGGAMDLVSGCDCVVVGMEHSLGGRSRVVRECTLPYTARQCVNKLITQYAVFEFRKEKPRMVLKELIPGMTLEELKKITPAEYVVSPELKPYQL